MFNDQKAVDSLKTMMNNRLGQVCTVVEKDIYTNEINSFHLVKWNYREWKFKNIEEAKTFANYWKLQP